jgi:transposase InsO family protein
MIERDESATAIVPQEWGVFAGLPKRSERTWLTRSEVIALLKSEGLRLDFPMLAEAVKDDRPKKFRAYYCYEPRHVAAARVIARRAIPSPRRRCNTKEVAT